MGQPARPTLFRIERDPANERFHNGSTRSQTFRVETSETNALKNAGIQVARLAGLPLSVIDRAKTILAKLESDDTEVSLPAAQPQAKPKKKITVTPADDAQLSLL